MDRNHEIPPEIVALQVRQAEIIQRLELVELRLGILTVRDEPTTKKD